MNERIIQDLIKQATIRSNNPLVNSDGKVVCDDWEEGVSLSKFAELIVRECAKYLEENSGADQCNNVWCPAPEDLLKHFGVEE